MPRRDTLARTAPRIGRRTSYTTTRGDTIIESVRGGNHLTVACATAGITTTTLYRWIGFANHADAAQEAGQPYDPDYDALRGFRDRLARARADAESMVVASVRRDIFGGSLVSEEPVMESDGNGGQTVARGDDGEILYKRTYTTPNGRVGLMYLQRSAPDRWSDKSTLEVTGPDGKPLAAADPVDPSTLVSPEEQATGTGSGGAEVLDLAARLALVARQRREGSDEVDPDAVHDIEVVEG